MNLGSLIIKRVMGIVVVVVTATFLLSLLMRLLPGDPATLIAAGAPEGVIQEIRKQLFLDRE